MELTLGNFRARYGLCLGPMAGYSDYAMRTVAAECGAEYSVTEMVSAKAVCYDDRKTVPLARVSESEGAVALQIFGCDPVCMAEAASKLEQGYAGGKKPIAIDINMGCPVKKIVSNGEGSALMKNPALAASIVRAVVDAVSLPVTVKIRAGWDKNGMNAPEMAKHLENAGASLITVHGRTREELYSGTVHDDVIREVARSVKIPVIGNGDVKDAARARHLMKECGCAGVMIARGAVGNPFLFREIIAELEGLPYAPPTLEDKINMAKRQLTLAIADRGEAVAVRESRKQLAAYLTGIRGGARVRAAICSAEKRDAVFALLDGLL